LKKREKTKERLADELKRLRRRIAELKAAETKRRQAEDALRTSEEKYRSVVDHIGVGVSLISPDMEILTLNRQMQTWFPDIDVSLRPVCYRAFNDPPREEVCSYCPTCRTLRDGQVHESIADTPRRDGVRQYRIISSPIKDPEGQVMAAIEMVDDITDARRAQEQLRESEAKYRTIFENTGTATLILDADMTISLVNTEFEKQSGYAKAEVEGLKTWLDIAAGEDRERMMGYHMLRRQVADTAPRNYEFRIVNRQGEMQDVFITIAMIHGTGKSVASLLNITERKQAEAALRQREQELSLKTQNLEDLNTALTVLLKRREEDRNELEEKVLANVKELIMPYLEKLKGSRLDARAAALVGILEANLENIISPFARKLSWKYLYLTPREIQVANLIREGKTTKEIAEFMNVATSAIDTHRFHIRKKLGLNNKRLNLQSYLATLG
jgi:PAS domain S-box-containing protein